MWKCKFLKLLEEILENTRLILLLLYRLTKRIEGFTEIKQGEFKMVPLAAGQTATFSTTPIPSISVPDASKIVWLSSDSTNAPVVANPGDTSGLSVNVTFPASTPAGLVFTLTVSYTNSDGTTATQTNSFTTVAPPSPDVTGFTDIVQVA